MEITDEESKGSNSEGQESVSFDSTRDISTSRMTRVKLPSDWNICLCDCYISGRKSSSLTDFAEKSWETFKSAAESQGGSVWFLVKEEDSHRGSHHRKYYQSYTHLALSNLGPVITWPRGRAITPSVSSNENVEKKSVVGSSSGSTRKLRAHAEPSLKNTCTILSEGAKVQGK